MPKYKVNIIYNSNGNINDIFIKVLLKEIQMIYNTYLSLKEVGKN